MEWISVHDRLPEKYDEYIVYFTNEEGSFVTCDAVWNGIEFESISSFRDERSNYSESGDKVTHWMPLPEPPKT